MKAHGHLTPPFELDLNSVKTKHVGILSQRRKRLLKWLQGLASVPMVPPSKKVQDFITYSTSLKSSIISLSDSLSEYLSRPTLRRPINILLQAAPGSGKSFLVKNICDILGSSRVSDLIEVNCSHLHTPKDLSAVFDRIRHLHDSGLIPIVFFDEVDVPQWAVYQYMIMPMWEGAYLSDGLRFKFESAVFFFAASFRTCKPRLFTVEDSEYAWLDKEHNLLRGFLDHSDAPPKASDFYSRIDFYLHIPPLRYHFKEAFSEDEEPYWQDEEMVQIAKKLIDREFPSVETIDTRVLAFLSGAFLETKRDLERLVFLSKASPGADTFSWDHLPSEFVRHGVWFNEVDSLSTDMKHIEK